MVEVIRAHEAHSAGDEGSQMGPALKAQHQITMRMQSTIQIQDILCKQIFICRTFKPQQSGAGCQ